MRIGRRQEKGWTAEHRHGPRPARAPIHTTLAASLLAFALLVVACGPASAPNPASTAATPTGPTAAATILPTAAATTATSEPTTTTAPEPTTTPTATEPAPSSTPGPAAGVVHEGQVSQVADTSAFPANDALEPTVATHPTDPRRIAAVYLRRTRSSTCGIDTPVRISHDGGLTWKTAKGRPWAGSGRGPNIHAVIAWGPGPKPGSARLYWADMTAPGCNYAKLAPSVAYSDDEGATWSKLYVERRTTTWIGGFPDITADRDPASPNNGAVYVAFNWPKSRTAGPGMRLIASADFGRTWRATVEIPPAPRTIGCAASWRIAYRVRTAPDGSVYVSGYQADLRHWDPERIFSKGGSGNICRFGFTVTRVLFDRARKTLTLGPTVVATRLGRSAQTVSGAPAVGTSGPIVDPQWCQGLDVDRATGDVYLAVADFVASPGVGRPHGVVRVGRSSDGGRTWTWRTLAPVTLPGTVAAGGGLGSSYKPSLAVRDGVVFVGFHVITDRVAGHAASHHPVVGTYYAVSLDGGRTFAKPAPITSARWPAAALERGVNGPGLRERADFTADGHVFYVYGDGRRAALAPAGTYGRGAIFGALIDPGVAR